MGSNAPAAAFVGRSTDLAVLRQLVRDVSAGRGGTVWVEGEPGIGKSSFVAAALSDATAAGCQVAWAEADELGLRSPLRVMLDCLGIRPHSPDERRARIARLLYAGPDVGVFGGVDPVRAVLERLLSLVDELCADGPLIMVIDDVQWADEPSLIAWHRLNQTVEQLPLLLVAASRPLPQRDAVAQLRHSVLSGNGVRIPLGPLAQEDVSQLVAELAGAPPGPRLRRLAAGAAGNPLYLVELLDALSDEGSVVISEKAELAAGVPDRLPQSLAAVITTRLSFLPRSLLEMLGAAALLGQEFAVMDLAALLGVPVSALLSGLRQADAAAVVTASDAGLRFRHPLIRQVLYDGLPTALRTALHRQAAQVLAESGADGERVMEQLLAAAPTVDRWSLDWVASHAETLTHQVPVLAAELLRLLVEQNAGMGTEQHEVVVSALAGALFRQGQHDEAEKLVRGLLAHSPGTERAAELRWLLARMLFGAGRNEQARSVIAQALRGERLSAGWRGRFQALSAMFLRADAGDLQGAELAAREALQTAEAAQDRFGIGYSLCVLWLVDSVRRDHLGALATAQRAIAVLGDDPEFVDLRAWARENQVFTLQNLDRMADAEAILREAHAEAAHSGEPAKATLHIGSAVHDFWAGRWDDALASLDSIPTQGPEATYFGLRERGPMLLHHGVTALIAGHRDNRELARRYLDAGLALPVRTVSDWENRDFLIVAQALEAERDGAPERALDLLSQILEFRQGQMNVVHQWLPDLVRLAMDLGEETLARKASAICGAEAAREAVPARAVFAERRCRALIHRDPAPVLEAAEHYAAVGRPFERALAMEDAAVLLALQGHGTEARTALTQAVSAYTDMGAVWDVRRADARVRPFGVRRGVRGPRPRASFGWASLSPTELRVARLVAEGKSNPQIAGNLLLSRRTVQTHVSHILAKLGAHSRVEIATEALHHPEPGGADAVALSVRMTETG
ncbi:tetratricopeptide repeat protein [Streptomyces sp. TLI_235]|nr:LuxR family transcriptional regulator [Streptomyces sp. TLI_235]PBC69624.1 tetratricopeptide repeat protein [Streptomyces sp. TLI_235]